MVYPWIDFIDVWASLWFPLMNWTEVAGSFLANRDEQMLITYIIFPLVPWNLDPQPS